MPKYWVNRKMLTELKACPEGIDAFMRLCPFGVRLDTTSRTELVDQIEVVLRKGANVSWFVYTLFDHDYETKTAIRNRVNLIEEQLGELFLQDGLRVTSHPEAYPRWIRHAQRELAFAYADYIRKGLEARYAR